MEQKIHEYLNAFHNAQKAEVKALTLKIEAWNNLTVIFDTAEQYVYLVNGEDFDTQRVEELLVHNWEAVRLLVKRLFNVTVITNNPSIALNTEFFGSEDSLKLYDDPGAYFRSNGYDRESIHRKLTVHPANPNHSEPDPFDNYPEFDEPDYDNMAREQDDINNALNQ